MKILISGSHGFIGSVLHDLLEQADHTLLRLIRPTQIAHHDEVFWDRHDNYIDHAKLKGIDAVIHLAGENIFGRWNDTKKQEIYDSRVRGTEFLCRNLAALESKPTVLLSASAVGYYGSRGDEQLTASSTPGDGFLSRVCQDAEAATDIAAKAGIRVVNLRFGVVLGKDGGAMAKMLPAFRMGAGGTLGDGKQWMSWISVMDTVDAIIFALKHETLSGPVNIVSPQPVQNKEFSRVLGKVLHRPKLLAMPKTLLHTMFGEFADETLLASTKAVPEKLLQAGFEFQHPDLQTALESILKS